jgi:hypothetical protein
MTIVFTLCSNNYLAQAKTLGESLHLYNPEYKFIIGLVDKLHPSIDYTLFKNCTFVPIEALNLVDFDSLWKKYNIIELNTSVKASYFKWIANEYVDAKVIFYLDPDICVYSSMKSLEQLLQRHSVILTPHILNPLPLDHHVPGENLFLNHGIYNLGFLGLNASLPETLEILDWWECRTLNSCFDNVADGFFVDQLWMNLVPIFYPMTHIIREQGYNVAPWNLHESRNIVLKNGHYVMGNGSLLVFYHFSSYKFSSPEILSKSYTRYQFEDCNAVIRDLYSNYHTSVMSNGYNIFHTIPCYYADARQKYFEVVDVNESNSNSFSIVICE